MAHLAETARGGIDRPDAEGGLVPYIPYLIAQESHHLGSILLTVKQSGHAVDKKIRDRL